MKKLWRIWCWLVRHHDYKDSVVTITEVSDFKTEPAAGGGSSMSARIVQARVNCRRCGHAKFTIGVDAA